MPMDVTTTLKVLNGMLIKVKGAGDGLKLR